MVDIVFPDQTSHYGSLFGGNALKEMGKAAFVVATRHSRKAVVMAATRSVNFTNQISKGEIVILEPEMIDVGNSSMVVKVGLWAESLLSHNRRQCGSGEFVMVALDSSKKPVKTI